MKLTSDQINRYKRDGFLILNDCLSESEVSFLLSEIPNTIEKDSPRIILEDNGAIRSIFAPHTTSKIFDNLSKIEKLVQPAEQLIGNPVYIHQYKINRKIGLKGDRWEWHQDFPYWHLDDGILAPELVSVMIYLQDTDASNGALMLIPKSHELGIVKFEHKESIEQFGNYVDNFKSESHLSSLNSNIKFTIEHSILKQIAEKNGIVTASGQKGTVVFFHGNIFHASNMNITPFDRDAVLITYNSIYNQPQNKKNPRPEYLCSTNCTPISCNS